MPLFARMVLSFQCSFSWETEYRRLFPTILSEHLSCRHSSTAFVDTMYFSPPNYFWKSWKNIRKSRPASKLIDGCIENADERNCACKAPLFNFFFLACWLCCCSVLLVLFFFWSQSFTATALKMKPYIHVDLLTKLDDFYTKIVKPVGLECKVCLQTRRFIFGIVMKVIMNSRYALRYFPEEKAKKFIYWVIVNSPQVLIVFSRPPQAALTFIRIESLSSLLTNTRRGPAGHIYYLRLR